MCKRAIVHIIEETEEVLWHKQLKLWFLEINFIFINQEWQGNMENILIFYAIFAFIVARRAHIQRQLGIETVARKQGGKMQRKRTQQ